MRTERSIEQFRTTGGLCVACGWAEKATVAAVQLWAKAGSAVEERSEAGLAHLVEHMVFRGTSSRGAGEAHRLISSLGGTLEARTDRDEVVFSVIVPPQHIEDALEILADAASDPLFRADDLASERTVVLEEIHHRLFSADDVLYDLAFSEVFGTSPYGRPTYGSPTVVAAAQPEDLRRLWHRSYEPSRSALVVTGPVDPQAVSTKVERAFTGRWPDRSSDGSPPPPDINHSFPTRRVLVAPAPIPNSRSVLAWKAPRFTDVERPAADLMLEWIAQCFGHVLVKTFREAMIHGGIQGLELATATDTVASDIVGLLDAIAKLQPPPQAWIEAMALRIAQGRRLDHTTMDGWASGLGHWVSRAGHAELQELYIHRLRTVQAAQLSDSLDKLIGSDGLHAVVLVPRGVSSEPIESAVAARIINRRTPQPRVEFASPRQATLTMQSDLTVVLAEDPDSVQVQIDAYAQAGQVREPEGQDGIASWAAQLLAQQIQINAEQLHTEWVVNAQAGRDVLRLRGHCASPTLATALAALTKGLSSTTWSSELLAQTQNSAVEQAHARLMHANAVNLDQFCRMLYGEHPYGKPITGTADSVASLRVAQLQAYTARLLAAPRWTIAISGPVDLRELEQQARTALSVSWGEPGVLPPVRPAVSIDSPRMGTVALPVTQHRLAYGFLGTSFTGQEAAALELLAAVLQGEAGRIFRKVRDERGLAYYTGVTKMDALASGWVFGYLATQPEHFEEATRCIIAEFDRLRHELIPAQEIEIHRRGLVGRRIIRQETIAARASRAAFARTCGIEDDTQDRYRRDLESLTAADLLECARQRLDPNSAVTSRVIREKTTLAR